MCKNLYVGSVPMVAGPAEWEAVMVEELRNIRREVLPNGLIVLTEECAYAARRFPPGSYNPGVW